MHLQKFTYTNSLYFEINAVEDLNLHGVQALSRGQYLAIGKHLCGPATGDYDIVCNVSCLVILIQNCMRIAECI
jgi:hypothetical protein